MPINVKPRYGTSDGDNKPGLNPEPDKFTPILTPEFVEALPRRARVWCEAFKDQQDRDVFFTALLVLFSNALPGLGARYRGSTVSANLYGFIEAPFGSGKSVTEYARLLFSRIQEEQEELHALAFSSYKRDHAAWVKESKRKDAIIQNEPEPPPMVRYCIPPNLSKAALLQLLRENPKGTVIYATEADAMTSASKQDWGDFHDVLRAAFHHEPVSSYRKTDREMLEIREPRLSVLLTGTPKQRFRLVPNSEDGLFSRLLFLRIKPSDAFGDVFASDEAGRADHFRRDAEAVLGWYREALTKAPYFSFSKAQEQEFVSFFKAFKLEQGDYLGAHIGLGLVNRYALITYRMSMVLTGLRVFTSGGEWTPTEEEFELVLQLSERYFGHTASIVIQSNEAKAEDNGMSKLRAAFRERNMELVREKRAEGMSTREIAEYIWKDKGKKSTVDRWLKEMGLK